MRLVFLILILQGNLQNFINAAHLVIFTHDKCLFKYISFGIHFSYFLEKRILYLSTPFETTVGLKKKNIDMYSEAKYCIKKVYVAGKPVSLFHYFWGFKSWNLEIYIIMQTVRRHKLAWLA
jgi:hypothetical protein